MKQIVILAATLAASISGAQTTVPTPISAGSPFSYSALWDFNEKSFDVLAGYRVGAVRSIFGKPWLNAQVLGLGGSGLSASGSNPLTTGGALVFCGPIAQGICWQIGPAVVFTAGEKPHAAWFFGISGSLGN